jgi:hypothetical protein
MSRRLLAAALAALPGMAAAQGPPKLACAAPEHRQFDFWVGRWDVSPTGKDVVVAQSLIEAVYNGCGVRENWMPKNHQDGGSLNIYLPAREGLEADLDRLEREPRRLHGGWNGQGHGADRQVGRAAGADDLHAER